jgi:hypothetical protein
MFQNALQVLGLWLCSFLWLGENQFSNEILGSFEAGLYVINWKRYNPCEDSTSKLGISETGTAFATTGIHNLAAMAER